MARALRIGYPVPGTYSIIADTGIYSVQGQDSTLISNLELFFSIDSPSVTEGNSGTVNLNFTVTARQSFNFDVLFDYTTQNSTSGSLAVAGVDYTAISGTKTLSAGQNQVILSVPIIGDVTVEPDEVLDMRLFNFRKA